MKACGSVRDRWATETCLKPTSDTRRHDAMSDFGGRASICSGQSVIGVRHSTALMGTKD